jgi:hypothetical protein
VESSIFLSGSMLGGAISIRHDAILISIDRLATISTRSLNREEENKEILINYYYFIPVPTATIKKIELSVMNDLPKISQADHQLNEYF